MVGRWQCTRDAAALTGITAAVVGVIANLAISFAVHTLVASSRAESWPCGAWASR